MAKDLWVEIKDLFKTDSQRDEERRKEVGDALEKEKSILEQLAALDKEYKDSLPKEEEVDLEKLFPSELGLKELTYDAESNDSIEARASQENEYGKMQALNALNEKYASQTSALNDSKRQAGQTLHDSYRQLEKLYDDLRKRTENDVLKRGLARSSIATSQLSDLDVAKLAGAAELQKSYGATVNDINGRINELEAGRDIALQELDLKYATELTQRIEELKAERDKTVLEYEKYNANVRKQNEEYARKRESDVEEYLKTREENKRKAEEEQAELEKKYGYTGDKHDNYAKRYDIAYEFYSSLSPEIAAEALAASPNMKYYLGAYYDKLMKALENAASHSSKKIIY